jgi:hypothetical protein
MDVISAGVQRIGQLQPNARQAAAIFPYSTTSLLSSSWEASENTNQKKPPTPLSLQRDPVWRGKMRVSQHDNFVA